MKYKILTIICLVLTCVAAINQAYGMGSTSVEYAMQNIVAPEINYNLDKHRHPVIPLKKPIAIDKIKIENYRKSSAASKAKAKKRLQDTFVAPPPPSSIKTSPSNGFVPPPMPPTPSTDVVAPPPPSKSDFFTPPSPAGSIVPPPPPSPSAEFTPPVPATTIVAPPPPSSGGAFTPPAPTAAIVAPPPPPIGITPPPPPSSAEKFTPPAPSAALAPPALPSPGSGIVPPPPPSARPQIDDFGEEEKLYEEKKHASKAPAKGASDDYDDFDDDLEGDFDDDFEDDEEEVKSDDEIRKIVEKNLALVKAELNRKKINLQTLRNYANEVANYEPLEPYAQYALAYYYYNIKKPNIKRAQAAINIAMRAKNPPKGASSLAFYIKLKSYQKLLTLAAGLIALAVFLIVKKTQRATPNNT